MEDNHKRYWKGLEELSNDPSFVKLADQEFPAYIPVKEAHASSPVDGGNTGRRDFLKLLGFGVAAVSLAACETPVTKTIPYLNKPEEITPGVANWYSSTFTDGGEYCSVLVKTREGRPIKIEGNPSSSISGGTSAKAQASVLSLYDEERLREPMVNGNPSKDWAKIDAAISSQLAQVAQSGGAIRLVSSTILSPSTKGVIADFITKYPTTKHVVYDANSASAIWQANQASFGKAVIPSYDFSKAKTIVGVGCDFLGTWISPEVFSKQYVQTRKLGKSKKEMSRHFQFETSLSLTGANADYRTGIKPSQEGLVVAALYNKVAKLAGASTVNVPAVEVKYLDQAAKDLYKAKGSALVVAGTNDTSVQILVNALNNLLGSYGSTIDLTKEVYYKQGNDADMASFIAEAEAGKVGAVIFYNANPVYNHPGAARLAKALPSISLSVSFADRADETASLCKFICPDNHYLESWDDAEPVRGFFSLVQPTISLFQTRQAQNSLLKWAGSQQDYYAYLQNRWRTLVFPLQTKAADFDKFWITSLHDGVFEPGPYLTDTSAPFTFNTDIASAASNVAQAAASGKGIELSLYEKVGIGNGSMANNPWLQELPDGISKACWDNYLTIPQKLATDMSLAQGDLVSVQVAGKTVVDEIPVLIQPGQTNGTVSLAIGYGRTKAGKAANNVGKNAYPIASLVNNNISFAASGVNITKTGGSREIAQTQTHHTIMARPIVQESVLSEYQKNPGAGRVYPTVTTAEGVLPATDVTLWNGHIKKNHSWGMAIDLNSCTGCGACVISCQAENNIPVVGRQEVINRREMHWLRIDRYYSSQEGAHTNGELEVASDNPEVVFQPMLCQHCSNAPCETVCPVLATTHSSEGLNQMTYNRCIGTRYCANNCPYKVRRFNWFKYFEKDIEGDLEFATNPASNDLGRFVLNPDVTVRSRGVMEKCTFCVQKIQEGKLNAKKERRTVAPDEIQTACSQSCATGAIVFGDMNNPESTISKILATENKERAFTVLEELNVKPQISYLTKIRNKDKA
ncbi:MAG: TAT-variant-translocated molybdopterin oxidoreductase [Bacteroidota bacterium]